MFQLNKWRIIMNNFELSKHINDYLEMEQSIIWSVDEIKNLADRKIFLDGRVLETANIVLHAHNKSKKGGYISDWFLAKDDKILFVYNTSKVLYNIAQDGFDEDDCNEMFVFPISYLNWYEEDIIEDLSNYNTMHEPLSKTEEY